MPETYADLRSVSGLEVHEFRLELQGFTGARREVPQHPAAVLLPQHHLQHHPDEGDWQIRAERQHLQGQPQRRSQTHTAHRPRPGVRRHSISHHRVRQTLSRYQRINTPRGTRKF